MWGYTLVWDEVKAGCFTCKPNWHCLPNKSQLLSHQTPVLLLVNSCYCRNAFDFVATGVSESRTQRTRHNTTQLLCYRKHCESDTKFALGVRVCYINQVQGVASPLPATQTSEGKASFARQNVLP